VLFNLINRLRASGGRLLAAASVPPLRLFCAKICAPGSVAAWSTDCNP
jgi:hypothetical protein